MSKLDALTNFAVFIKIYKKRRVFNEKDVVLGLVLGGIGFVANDAQAAKIGDGVKVHSADIPIKGYDVKTSEKINTTFAEQKDLVAVNEEAAAAAKAADKAVTDAANAQTTANEAKDAAAKNADDIKTNADNIEANSTAISAETEARIKADEELDKKIGENTKAINNEVTERKAEDARLDGRIDTNVKDIAANKTAIENEATTRANEDKRIEAKFDGEVSRLDSKIDKLDARVEKVGAMAAAIANLHTMGYDPEAPTEIAVGVGQYRDKTGMALGAFHYPNRDFMLSFSVSTAGDEYMGGIGATWKFGRKTPEELRQAEAEKAAKAKLAKAEAAKKAAKDARVAAQQKRHAEMLAARTAK